MGVSASATAEIGGAGEADQHKVVLVADRVSKAFPGVLALDEVSLEVRSGEVNALVGENGAGKSTLIKLMAGFYAPDSGEIRIGGQLLRPDPAAAHEAGIATIHQDHHLIPSMTVAENLLLGRWPTRFGVLSRASMLRQAEAVLDQVAPNLSPRKLARQLSPAESQLVEIARALAENSRVLIMDEPTTSLSGREVDALFDTVSRLKAHGLAIVFVSHWLEEVFAIADRVTVLRDGRFVGSKPSAELDHDAVIRMMVGRDVEEVTTQSVAPGPVVLKVEGLSRAGVIDNVSFEVRAGEIVTLAGLVGAGRSEVVNAIFGADPFDAGSVSVGGVALPPGDPTAAMEAGIGYIPEDRRRQALVASMPWPQRAPGLIETAFDELARRWKPILNAFDDAGVDVAFEIHPGEDIFDGATFERFLDALKGHKRCNILYDPSHFLLQQLDYVAFIDLYHERIKAFHAKDAEFNPTGRQGVYSGYASWVERAGRFRSLGDGQVDFGTIFSKLAQYDYSSWAVLEWECCLKHPEDGAREGAEFIKHHIIRVTEKAFDDFAGGAVDKKQIKRALGLR